MTQKLGIIGGMGPAATAELFCRIIQKTSASSDQEHLHIIVDDDPSTPDRTAFLLGQPGAADFTDHVVRTALGLEAQGCEVLAVPCNTTHARYDEITSHLTSSALLHMPRATAIRAKDSGARRVAVLATDGTLKVGVYERALATEGLEQVTPSPAGQETVMELIYDFAKAGKEAPRQLIDFVFNDIARTGCDAAILGCTELSILGIGQVRNGIQVIDALDELARACVTECGGTLRDMA